MDMNYWFKAGVREMLVGRGVQGEGNKGEKKWNDCNFLFNKIYLKCKKILMYV